MPGLDSSQPLEQVGYPVILMGGIVLALWLWQRTGRLSTRALLFVLLGVGLACRLAILWRTPIFYAPDEQSHYAYVRYLAERRAFPVQTSQTDAASNDWEYYQPPLYYIALAPCYALADALWDDPFAVVRALRFVSILLWGATAWFAWRTLHLLGVEDAVVRAAAMGMVCLLPTYAFLSSSLNNDNALIALGSGLLCLSLGRSSPRRSAGLGLVLGLALLTKLTAVVYVAWLGLLALARIVEQPRSWRAEAAHLALTVALAAVIWAPWGARNWAVYGSITAEEVANVPRAWESLEQAARATLRYMQDSFWAVSGIYNNVRGDYPDVGRWAGYVAVAGWAYGLLARRRETVALAGARGLVVAAMALAVVANAVLVFRFGVLYGQGQGRFLFPLLIPLALLLAVGWRAFGVPRAEQARVCLAGFQIAYLVSFVVYSLGVFGRV